MQRSITDDWNRVYVRVNATIDKTGYMLPTSITWDDGRTFPIDSIISVRPASSVIPHLSGDCYHVMIHGEQKHLYFDRVTWANGGVIGRWSVLIPTA